MQRVERGAVLHAPFPRSQKVFYMNKIKNLSEGSFLKLVFAFLTACFLIAALCMNDRAQMALDVLGMMSGYKIVVTPGMIELGSSEYKENYDFGCRIADVADEVILIGEKQTEAIKQGLESMGYDNKKIHIEEDVINAFPLINKLKRGETYVLLENDLPDIFK